MAHRGTTTDPNVDGRRSPATFGDLHVTPTERGYESDPNAETLSSVDLSYKRQTDKYAYDQDLGVFGVAASSRGYGSDPNSETLSSEAPTKRPFQDWVYYQEYEVIQQTLPSGGDIGELFDKEFSFTCDVTSGTVDHTFAAIKVVDGPEPITGEGEADVDLGDLAIDSDGIPALQAFIVNPSSLEVFDGWLISDPQPRPVNWDGGTFAQWNQGTNIDGLVYRIIGQSPTREQELEVYRFAVFEDGSLLRCDGFDEDTFLDVSREFGYKKIINPGDIVGRINYEVVECVAVITDWSHYNWDDDTPIRKAFRALVKNLPSTVTNVYVPVPEAGNSQLKTSPDRALWTALGFVPISKDSQMLIYSPDDNLVPY